MIRPFTLICVLLAAGSGLYLYQAKHRAHMLDHEIGEVVHATEQARARSAILQAEWQLLNDTERLSGLADRFLGLKSTSPGQFATLADLAKRLPPVRAIETRPAAEPDEDLPPLMAEDTPIPPLPPEKPVGIAAIPTHQDAKPVEHASAERRPATPASDAARPALETRVATKPSVMSVASVTPPRPQAMRYAAPPPMAPMVGSSLGMARTSLPPPMPIGYGFGRGNPAEAPGGG